MYINPCFFSGLWTKINEILLKNTKKSLILSLKIWRSSSIPAASRTLGIVWGASGMITTQHQRTPLVPGALWRSAVDVIDCFNGFSMEFSLIFVNFVDFVVFHDFPWKPWKNEKSMNGQWKNGWHTDCADRQRALSTSGVRWCCVVIIPEAPHTIPNVLEAAGMLEERQIFSDRITFFGIF